MTNEELGKAQYEYKQKYKYKIYRNSISSFLITISSFVIIAISLLMFVFGFVKVTGTGMNNTLKTNNVYIVNKVAYKMREPNRGDIILSNGKIARIIGLPNEEISLYGGNVYVDDAILVEDYITGYTYAYDNIDSFTVPMNAYFVLCDNRNCFEDSRCGLYVIKDDIIGRILTPSNKDKSLFDYIYQLKDIITSENLLNF